MKQLFFLLFVVVSNFALAQQDIFVETSYKNTPKQEFVKQHYSFSFLQKKGIILKKDLATGVEKKYYVSIEDALYSEDGKYFVLTYSTDSEKHAQNGGEDSEIGRFSIIYDNKKTNILAVKVKMNNHYQVDVYKTEAGIEILP